MLIPKIFHGTYKTVTEESRKVVERLMAGEMLDQAVRADEALDSLELPDQIVIDPPYAFQATLPAFYLEPLGEMLGEGISSQRRFSPERERALFMEFLEQPWGLVTLLGYNNAQLWLLDTERRVQFLGAVEQHRSVLEAAGACFSGGTTNTSDRHWWQFTHGVGFALVNLGIPREATRQFSQDGVMPGWELLAPDLELAWL